MKPIASGLMRIPTFEIVEDQFDPGGRRKFFDVYVNGKKVSFFPDVKSAETWIQNIKDIVGIH